MCSSIFSVTRSSHILSSIVHSERRDQSMRQVVAYKKLKTMENQKDKLVFSISIWYTIVLEDGFPAVLIVS